VSGTWLHVPDQLVSLQAWPKTERTRRGSMKQFGVVRLAVGYTDIINLASTIADLHISTKLRKGR
jgi:hypothetical protein